MPKTKTLSPKEQRFVEEYPVDFSAAGAMRRAGYKGKTEAVLRVSAYRMLTKPAVQIALQDRIGKLTERADEITRKVIQELLRIAFSDIRKLFNADGGLKEIRTLDDESAACIASIEIEDSTIRLPDQEPTRLTYTKKVKLWDKNSALDKLCRYMALYKDPGTKENPLYVHHVKLSQMSLEELTRIRKNPELAVTQSQRN
jgi:phage terminase small subunit